MTDQVGTMVRRRRDALGLSAQALADACTELGYPMARNSVANLENGRRSEVSVAELAVMAEVLKLPPVELLFGSHLVTGEVEHLPGRMVTAWGALLWFTGEWPSDGDRGRRLDLIRELETIPQRRRDTEAELAKSRRELDEARIELAEALPLHVGERGDLNEARKVQREIYMGAIKRAERMVEFYRASLDTLQQRERDIAEELRAAGYVVELPLWNSEGKQ